MPSERDYAERLREQAYKTLSPQINDLEKELKEFSDAVSTGIYQIERKLEAINQVELPTTKVVLDEILQDVLRQKDQAEKSLVHFTRYLRVKETQEEILGLLLDYANGFFPRVALFTVRNDLFAGWSSRGYSEETARTIADCSFPCSECVPFQEALGGEDIKTVSDLSGNSSLSFLEAKSGRDFHLVPLRVMQRPVAILFVEGSDDAASRLNILSILTNLTELRLENIALGILYALTEGKSVAEPQPSTAVEQAEEAALETPAEAETAEETEPETPAEAEPVVETPPEPLEPEVPETEVGPRGETAEAEPLEAPSEAGEEMLHTDAKRFARLLVSEIKLYNENTVSEGRENHDLYIRLKRDIDKSREMYENRVSPVVLQKIDYFHDEIVRILCENDPSTLGSDYPGPRVES